MSNTTAFQAILADLQNQRIDPNEVMPLANRKETIYGVTIPFHVLSWLAVIFRLHTRLRVTRNAGWDDAFVLLAAIFNLISLAGFLPSLDLGLGQHLIQIPTTNLVLLFKHIYTQNAAYHTTAFIIKISLLCQYLRIFPARTLPRSVTFFLLFVITLWGLAFMFMSWVPCFPVAGFWDKFGHPDAKCYGFGFSKVQGPAAMFIAFAASNMALDIVVFAVPVWAVWRPGQARERNIGRRTLIALGALFGLGAIVITLSVLRLWTAAKHTPKTIPNLDFTHWYPPTLILASLEVDVAIMCASIPIFWPMLSASLDRILVTKEVLVTSAHQRLDDSERGGQTGLYELERTGSGKSGGSRVGLTGGSGNGSDSDVGKGMQGARTELFVVDHFTGKAPAVSEVRVQGLRRG